MGMDMSVLEKIGLTNDQAKTYRHLLETGSMTPPQLAKVTGDSRTNAYMSLAKVEEIGIATRERSGGKLTYRAVSPAKLESLLDSKESELQNTRDELRSKLPDLLTAYYTNSTKPGIRFFEGSDSIDKVYKDHLETGEEVHLVRTPADEDFFGPHLYEYMKKRALLGIPTQAIAPYSKEAESYAKANDAKLKRAMTWCAPDQYQAPVEISIYGNKTAFISFGKEVVATIIDSPQIAKAMKELFALSKSGAHVNDSK